MFDIITFGSASKDIFLRAKQFLVGNCNVNHAVKEIMLPYGYKVDIEDIHFHSGGGGTNVAATFSAQGFKTAYCGLIGKDPEGEAIISELKSKNIETKFIVKTDKKPTNLSIIFSTPKERTILAYRGASKELGEKDIPWSTIKKTKWLYLAPLGNSEDRLFNKIIDFAKKNKIKVMVNPGSSSLNLSRKRLIHLLKKIDILLLNQEEAQTLIKNKRLSGKSLLTAIKKIFPGLLIITNASQKVFLANDNKIFSALPFKAKIIDKTGAGDAFGAGFLASYIRSKGDVVSATQLAIANSISCVKKWGAKEGILQKKQAFKKVNIRVHENA